MKPANLIELSLSRRPVEEVIANLMSKNSAESIQAGKDLIASAANVGIDPRDYLRLAVDTTKGDFANNDLDGYQTALMALNLPIRDDFAKGIVLQAAAETFQTFPGVRALFPQVIDDVVHWKYRQDGIESVDGIISQSRTVSGVEMITTVVNDDAESYQQTGIIAESGRIPVRSIRGTEYSVKFFKFGGGYKWTYEFARRASLDIMAPYAARMEREVQIGQVSVATNMLVNGDAVNPAAPVVDGKALCLSLGNTYTQGNIDWETLLKWLIDRARAGTPVDTIVGNWDMHFQWLRMFAKPSLPQGIPQIEALRQAGVSVAEANPNFNLKIDFRPSSAAPLKKLIGFSKVDTLEELVETGSQIEESQAAIQNQEVTYVRTRNAGYRLIFGDTRSILDMSAA